VLILVVAACSGYTTPPSNIAKQPDGSYTAQLNFVASCGAGGHCSWYAQYRQVGTSAWMRVPATPHGPVAGQVSNVSLSETATGLIAGAQYEYQVCGNAQPGQPFTCVGPDDTPNTTTTFSTPAGFSFAKSLSANHRYVLDQRGNPYLIVGDAPQALIGNLSESDMDKYFADRQAHHINVAWVNLLCASYTACNSDGSTFDHVPPFLTPGDLSTPNPAYFQRVDDMLNLAAKHGITVFLDPAETGSWLSVLDSNGTTKDTAYGRYLGSRYKSFPNIVWLNGNDFQTWSDAGDDASVFAVADGIRAAGDTHLQTVELNYTLSLSTDDPNWLSRADLNAAYTYYPTYDDVLKGYNVSTTKPVFMVEAHYDSESVGPGGFGSPVVLRRQEYWTMTSGAAGQLYGSQYWGLKAGWQTGIDSVGASELKIMADFFQSQPWFSLVPDQSHSLVTAGYGTYDAGGSTSTNDYVTAAMTANGTTAVVYLPSAHTITLNMAKLRGTVTAKWFDPTTGQYTSIGTLSNSGTHQFAAPGTHSDGNSDWVLLLTTS
jgi:hypothetical protein